MFRLLVEDIILNFLFLQSTRDESSLDRHTYSILEAGLYVPTEVCETEIQ